jgi:hypothetical protein
MTKLFTSIILIAAVFSCQTKGSLSYRDFFDQTFTIIKEKSVKRNDLDWVATR